MPNVGYATIQIIPSVRGISDELRRQLVGPAGDAGGDAGQAAGTSLKDKLKVGAAAAGAAAGALLVAGIGEAMEQANITSSLQAQLGTTGKVAADQGKIAGKLYSSGVSGSFQEAADAIKSVVQSGLAPPGTTNDQLQAIATKATDVANIFGQELGGVTNAVSQMIRTGLAKNSTEAFDLITKGFQGGTDKAGDFLDTINEYGTQFRKAGLDGASAIGLLNQAIGAGARDADVAADAIKEFSIRAVDGSESTSDGFKALGLNADDMAAKFAKGGKAANGVLDLTLDRLRGIKDPVKQSQAAVALFGTQAEDLGAALFALDPSKAAAGLGTVAGAADKAGKAIHSGPSHEIEVFTRTLKQGFVDFIGGQVLPVISQIAHGFNVYLLPPIRIVGSTIAAVLLPALSGLWTAGTAVVQWLRDMGTWLIPIGIAVTGFTAALLAQQIATAAVTAVFSIYRGAILAWTAVQRAATIAQVAFNAVMNANPVILVITAIVALGAALVIAYQRSATFRSIVQGAWQGIQTAVSFTWNSVLKPAFAGIMTGLRAVGAAAVWLWNNAIKPAFQFIDAAARILLTVLTIVVFGPIYLAVKVLGAVFGWLWKNAIAPAFRLIAAGAQLLWDGLKVVFGYVMTGLKTVGGWFKWLYDNAVKPAWAGVLAAARVTWSGVSTVFGWLTAGLKVVGGWFRWLYDNAVKPVWQLVLSAAKIAWTGVSTVFGWLTTGLKTVGGWFKWLWEKGAQPAFNGVKSVISGVWNNGIKPVFDALKSAVKKVGESFETARQAIKIAWDKVKAIAKAPVAFVINTVYNGGIVPVWNKVASAFGAPKLGKIKGWATGGPVFGAGTETSDDVPAWLSRNEHVWTAREVRGAGGHGAVMALRKWAAAGGTGRLPGFADGGGLFGWIGKGASKLAGLGSSAWDKVKAGAKWLKDTIAASARAGINAIVNPLLKRIPGLNSGFGRMIARVPKRMIDSLFGYAKQADEKGGSTPAAPAGVGPGPGSGVNRWRGVVRQALGLVGQPLSYDGITLRRMNQESGGNPRAVNLWDINARRGYPSAGLMQVIRPTFQAYAGRFRNKGPFMYGVSVDPLANIYASMRYALAAYGSLPRAYNRAGGYDNGGWLQPGVTTAVNATGRPEAVLTASQWRVAEGAMAGAGRLGDLQVAVYVGNEQITDIARAEVRTAQGELIQVLNAS